MTDLAHYYFVPTAREGLAACITSATTGMRSTVTAKLTPSADGINRTPILRDVSLFGPGDVIGLEPRVVTRTDPRPNVWDFEPNFMVFAEFGGEPDLPWRFTPDVATTGDSGALKPWISLIVLRTDEYEGVREMKPPEGQKKALPSRWINQAQFSKLPDLTHAAKWAHVQATAEDNLTASDAGLATLRNYVSDIDPDGESHVVSRLMCARRLAPNSKYTAFIVPTFKAGLIGAGMLETLDGGNALTLCWDKSVASPPTAIDIPYYYRWDFGTGLREDFEQLVRQLVPRPLPGLGRRPMDASQLPYGIPGLISMDEHIVQLEGALKSPGMPSQALDSDDDQVNAFQSVLAGVLNLGATHLDPATRTNERPKVVPPVYGSWHSGNATVNTSNSDRWKNDVNLDPRGRAAAGYGALIIEQDQEPLLASAWDQLGNVDEANQILRNAQLALHAARVQFERLGKMRPCDFLWSTAPVHSRISVEIGDAPRATINNYLANSPIPTSAFDPAFRRLLRRRGAIRKLQSLAPPTVAPLDMLSRLNSGEIAAAGPPPDFDEMPSLCSLTDAALSTLRDRRRPPRTRPRNSFRITGIALENGKRRPLAEVVVHFYVKPPRDRLTRRRQAVLRSVRPVASSTTDKNGRFIVDIDRSLITRWLADGRPDVIVRVDKERVPYPNARYDVRAIQAHFARVLVFADVGKGQPHTPSRANDFCEEAVTCDRLQRALAQSRQQSSKLHTQVVTAMCDGLDSWLAPGPHVAGPLPVNLAAVEAAVKAAIDPGKTIPARVAKRLKLGAGVRQHGILGRIESPIEFPQPMYEPLAAISQDLVLPGVQTVPQDTLSILETNRRFLESYMLGLNHSFASECLWRGLPVILQTSFFRQFWQVDGLVDPTPPDPETLKDITRFGFWIKDSALGSHDPRGALIAPGGASLERAVLLLRGRLLLRYPQTLIYAVKALANGDPDLSDHTAGASDDRVWPIFSGTLAPDLTFMGFDLTAQDMCTKDGVGYYIVIEERLGEPRFGFDLLAAGTTTPPTLPPTAWWYDMTWEHFTPAVAEETYINGATPPSGTANPQWTTSAATVANTCLQRPVRVAVHASRMLDKSVCPVPTNGV